MLVVGMQQTFHIYKIISRCDDNDMERVLTNLRYRHCEQVLCTSPHLCSAAGMENPASSFPGP